MASPSSEFPTSQQRKNPPNILEWDAIEWIFGRKAFSPRISSTVLLFTVVINGWKSPNLSLIKLTFGRKILPYLWYILGKGQVWAGSFTRHFLVVQSEEEWRHKCGQWESWIRRRWDGVEPFLFILPRHRNACCYEIINLLTLHQSTNPSASPKPTLPLAEKCRHLSSDWVIKKID